jgi:CHAT domain-containing protein
VGLNQGLGPVVRPDDTIVFCPTGVLHSLPLHAVPVDGVPIIENYPVVYCPNLTMLRHCFRNLQVTSTPSQGNQAPKRVVMNTMRSHWSDGEPVKSIADSLRLSSTLNATLIQGCDHKKEEAKFALNGAALFHYHGHAKFVRDSAMRSYLVLDGRGPTDASLQARQPAGESPSDRRLSAEDIFGCTMAEGGALATLVGCRSGGADVSAADDVLGLPMALHYAGATAVVSSLWRLEDEDGAAWAESFYGTLTKEREDLAERMREARTSQADAGGQKLVNLARAMQQAVRKLRFDADGKETAPYHWAAYVLSGYWMLSSEILG